MNIRLVQVKELRYNLNDRFAERRIQLPYVRVVKQTDEQRLFVCLGGGKFPSLRPLRDFVAVIADFFPEHSDEAQHKFHLVVEVAFPFHEMVHVLVADDVQYPHDLNHCKAEQPHCDVAEQVYGHQREVFHEGRRT